jgi:hypothetical protein
MGESVLSAIDAVESWIVLLPLYVQIVLLLAVFLPLCWLIAKVVDPLVEWVLRPHAERSGRVRDGDA